MKKLLLVLLISLVCCSTQQIEKDLVVISFDNDQEAQDSVEYTMCLKIIEEPEFLDYVKQLIEEGEYPEDSDLEETALSVCLSVSQSSEPFKTASTNFIPKARAGQLRLYTCPIKKELEPSPYLPPPDLLVPENELILKSKGKVIGILKALKVLVDTVIDAVVDFINKVSEILHPSEAPQ